MKQEINATATNKEWTCMGIIHGYIPGMTDYIDIPVYVDIAGVVSFVYIGKEARQFRDYNVVETCRLHSFLTNELFLYKSRQNEATELCEMVAELYKLSYGININVYTYDKDKDPFIYEMDEDHDMDRFPDFYDEPETDEEYYEKEIEYYTKHPTQTLYSPDDYDEDEELPF